MTVPIVLITGASRGLGRSAALNCAAQGIDVVLTYRNNAAQAQSIADDIAAMGRRAAILPLDLTASSTFPAFAQNLKSVLTQNWGREDFDFLVNNAGFGVHAALADTSESQFDELMNVHFKGVFFLTQILAPMIAQNGRILNVSSGLTRFALPGFGAYAAMKGAIEVLTKYMAKELGPRAIRVNVVAPGAVETDFGGGAVRDNAQINDFVAANTALGRAGLPDDIGGAIAGLLGPGAQWINGQRIEASGGMFL